MKFELHAPYQPAGDQPTAIAGLVDGLRQGLQKQTLLGVTGSGKTFTIANIIQEVQKPTLVIAHNKTLAAQLAQEFRDFFPNNAVHYFVSYYDYYQPEAYMPHTDTYIEKEAQINEEIDRLRHACTQSLLTRSDVIIVASVSCIYGLGSPDEYRKLHLILNPGTEMSRTDLIAGLVRIHYTRTTADLKPGQFRALGTVVEIMPIQEKTVLRITVSGSRITGVLQIDPVTSQVIRDDGEFFLFPAKHYITEEGDARTNAIAAIEQELNDQLAVFESEGKLLEYERLKRRTKYDLAMIREVGYCNGIENYSRQLSSKPAGAPPETLLSYFPHNTDGSPAFLTIIDESHVTIPQLGGMYAGDQSRKKTLIEHGFRLPSARDNRPLQSPEFWERVGQAIFVSATPSVYEREHSEKIVEQIVRPTGLVDPEIIVRPITPTSQYTGQVQDFIREVIATVESGGRVLATTLTKQMAEDLAGYLTDLPTKLQNGRKFKTEYLHSDVETLDRIQILTKLRKGEIDCLVGVNLLREGLDLPEVTLVGILDADKEGFLRSETSLIQTMGRAARNVDGRVILYADRMTGSMERAIAETSRRRDVQIAYNTKHNITPQSITKQIRDITELLQSDHDKTVASETAIDMNVFGGDIEKLIVHKRTVMESAAAELDFETAAIVRDEIRNLTDRLTRGDKKPRTKPSLDKKLKRRK